MARETDPVQPKSEPESGVTPAEALVGEVRERLEAARHALEELLLVRLPRTVLNTLVPYDEIQIQLDAASNKAHLLERVHPDPLVRAAAEKCTQETVQFATELSLHRGVYEALRGLDLTGEDADTRHYV